jgi:hypothetical protein
LQDIDIDGDNIKEILTKLKEKFEIFSANNAGTSG